MQPGSKAVEVHTARESGCIKRDAMAPFPLDLVDKNSYLSTKDIVHCEVHSTRLKHIVADRGEWVEGVGIVLPQTECLYRFCWSGLSVLVTASGNADDITNTNTELRQGHTRECDIRPEDDMLSGEVCDTHADRP